MLEYRYKEKSDKEYQKTLRQKYNPDNIFKRRDTSENTNETSENIQMVEYKETNFRKIINKIKNIFKKN